MPKQNSTEWATIGRIVAPFGIRGELKVRSLSDIPERFAQLESAYLSPEYLRYIIEGVRPYKGDMLLLKLAGIHDVNAAETLRDRNICIPADQLAVLPPDQYYQHDILGLQVLTLSGQPVGTIVDIMPTSGNDVYVVKSPTGRQVLIPAVKVFIKQVDLVRRTMYIEPIAGLIDDNAVLDEQGNDEGKEE